MNKWNRKLGTSKREQGIITPKAPQNRGRKIKPQKEKDHGKRKRSMWWQKAFRWLRWWKR